MKKIVLILLSLLAVGLFLVGCAPGKTEDEAIAGEASQLAPVTGISVGNLFLLPIPSSVTYPGEILEYKGADKVTKTNPKIKFKQWSTGETLEYSIINNQASIKLGGKEFLVKIIKPTVDNSPILVDFDSDGRVDSNTKIKQLYYKEGITYVQGTGG